MGGVDTTRPYIGLFWSHEKNYTHLSKTKRRELEELDNNGYSRRVMARMLGRSPNTISYELRHNEVNGEYTAPKAQAKAVSRRKAASFQGKKIVRDPLSRAFVDKALLDGQSSQAIAGRLKAGLEPELPYVSRDTIEEYVRSAHGRQIEYELKALKAGQKKYQRRR